MKIEPKNCDKCYIHDIFTSEQKDNFIANFKLEPITIYQLGFVMKVLRKCCRHSTSQKLPKHIQISPKAQIKCLIVIF